MVHFSLIVPYSFLVITFLVATFVVATPVPSPTITITSISTDGPKYPNLSCVNSSDCQWIDGICDDGVCVCLDRFDSAKNVCVEVPPANQPKPTPQRPKSFWNELADRLEPMLHGFGLYLLVVLVLPSTVFVCVLIGFCWCACCGFCSNFQATVTLRGPEQKNQGPGGLKTGLKAGSSSGGTSSDDPSSSSGQASSIPASTQA